MIGIYVGCILKFRTTLFFIRYHCENSLVNLLVSINEKPGGKPNARPQSQRACRCRVYAYKAYNNEPMNVLFYHVHMIRVHRECAYRLPIHCFIIYYAYNYIYTLTINNNIYKNKNYEAGYFFEFR